MKTKAFLSALCGAAAALGLAACATDMTATPDSNATDSPAAEESSASRAPSHFRKAERLVAAFCKNDKEAFLKELPPDTHMDFKDEQYDFMIKDVRERYGEPVSFEYVTELETPLVHPHVWKIRFKKKTSDGKDFTHEILYRVLVGNADRQDLILGFRLL